MKLLIVVACAIVVVSGDEYFPGAQHLPVIGPNGVPVDTAAVQQATAAHLQHKQEATARNGDYTSDGVNAARYPDHDYHYTDYYPSHDSHYDHHHGGYYDNHHHGGYYDHHHHEHHHGGHHHGHHKFYPAQVL